MQNFLGRLQSSSFLLKFRSIQFLNLELHLEKSSPMESLGTVWTKPWSLWLCFLSPFFPFFFPFVLPSLLSSSSFSLFQQMGHILFVSVDGIAIASFPWEPRGGGCRRREAVQRRKGVFRFKRNLVCDCLFCYLRKFKCDKHRFFQSSVHLVSQ